MNDILKKVGLFGIVPVVKIENAVGGIQLQCISIRHDGGADVPVGGCHAAVRYCGAMWDEPNHNPAIPYHSAIDGVCDPERKKQPLQPYP